MSSKVWQPPFERSVDRKAGQIARSLQSQHARARSVSAVPRKACSASSEALWGARWTRESSKVSCEAESTSLSHPFASLGQSGAAVRACVYFIIYLHVRPFLAPQTKPCALACGQCGLDSAPGCASRSPSTSLTSLWIEKQVESLVLFETRTFVPVPCQSTPERPAAAKWALQTTREAPWDGNQRPKRYENRSGRLKQCNSFTFVATRKNIRINIITQNMF